MAKAKNNSRSKFVRKVHLITETDLFKSVAIASLLFNVLFFISIIVLTTTSTFDRGFYMSAKKNYCKNVDGVRQRAEKLNSEKAAIREWQISCISDEFAPFYQEALDKFKAQSDSGQVKPTEQQ